MVDRTPPMAGTVGDGTERGDVDYQSDLTTLCVSWESFRDPESGIAEIHWGIGEKKVKGFCILFCYLCCD